jgi:phosphate acetyltransferase
MSVFFEQLIERASNHKKTIVLPEGGDSRTIEAAAEILRLKFANLVILGQPDELARQLRARGADPSQVQLLNPKTNPRLNQYAEAFHEFRKHKGVTLEQASKIVQDEVYFGTLMLKLGQADGLVAGAIHSTGDTLRPALQIIKPAAGISTVSSMFFMCFADKTLLFADCGLVEDPTERQLVDIAVSTAATALQFGMEARVAMLSYSTKGSATGPNAVKMAIASQKAKEAVGSIFGDKVILDGELQFDAAYVPSVAARKCPQSPLKGNANIFIFPDLGAGNLCYKSIQRLAGAEAYGPIVQGLAKPVNDLSRGCSAHDIVAATAITAIQATS